MAAMKLTLTHLHLQAPRRALEQSVTTSHHPRSPWPVTEHLGDTGSERWHQRHKPPVTKRVSPGVVTCGVLTITAYHTYQVVMCVSETRVPSSNETSNSKT